MNKVRILIVENESLVARDIQARLRQIGYQADWIAVSGEEAVKFAAEFLPQLVLMDIKLGGGIDGVETVGKIHATQDIPIVYLTAYSDEASLMRAKLTEPHGYVIKPVETADLRIAIEIGLHRHDLQSKLNEAHRCLSTTLASIGDGVIATDSNGVVTIANRIAAAMLGKEESNLLGKKIDEIFRMRLIQPSETPGVLRDPVTELLATKVERLAYSEVLLHQSPDTETPIDVTATLIVDDQKNPDGAVLVFRDVTARRKHEADLRYRAYHDNLTGLPNRSMFYDRMHSALAQCARHSRNLALLFLDLDDFKTVNDSLGHDAGDLLLQQLAGRLKAAVRDDDTVARLAGDEFVVILNDIANVSDVKEIVEKILSSLGDHFQLGETAVTITASIGISLFPTHGTEIEKLIRYADTAMYLAKQKGKNAYEIYTADWKNELPQDKE